VPAVFCIGLTRTGTTSFGDACEVLGFARRGWWNTRDRSDSHYLLRAWTTGHIAHLEKLAKRYDVLEDLPWPLVYKEMAEAFPDAKFALTLRSSTDVWLQSMIKHVADIGGYGMYRKVYGSAEPAKDPEVFTEYYERHTSEVRSFFAGSDRLVELCWEQGDGWPEVCAFMDVPEPDAPFPHANPAGAILARTSMDGPKPTPARRPWLVRQARKLRRRLRKKIKF
jgi:Sulfotransferase domain